jgi:hypothetical protein
MRWKTSYLGTTKLLLADKVHNNNPACSLGYKGMAVQSIYGDDESLLLVILAINFILAIRFEVPQESCFLLTL